MNNEHWSKDFFKQKIISRSSLGEGRPHHLELIELSDQSKWVCKKFDTQTWLGQVEESNLELTEELAATVAAELGITFAAYKKNNKFVFIVDGAKAIIHPYCEGQVIEAVNEEQAFVLGEILAQLHLVHHLPQKAAQALPSILLPEDNDSPVWLQELISFCNDNAQYQAENWVFSHRDIHAENIVWREKKTPHLLDWESAGLIHPAIELIGLAENCSGLAYGDFQAQRFRATLIGYGQRTRTLPQMNPKLWMLSFHTWLLWYSYCLQHNRVEEAKYTRELIEFIKENLPKMQKIYSDCQSFFNNSI
ncbi:putative aminoglycoside phosphotransferase [Legionella nautarum]|uniref:Putative aminoglycoside phosphotransferase n=1 Tax=Legionella nautarum TaxID=45070 RepID=A0A0W0WLH7_9GAMM|nr:phosphotransferase [Legionella nautarum]KTD33195.1 putative aminoglycoside phosphotransferase [Legionella nautarum]